MTTLLRAALIAAAGFATSAHATTITVTSADMGTGMDKWNVANVREASAAAITGTNAAAATVRSRCRWKTAMARPTTSTTGAWWPAVRSATSMR